MIYLSWRILTDLLQGSIYLLPFITRVHPDPLPDLRAWLVKESVCQSTCFQNAVLSAVFPFLLSHRTSFQLEWLHCTWGSLAEHLPALYWGCSRLPIGACHGQGQPCRARLAPAWGPGRPASRPQAFSPVAACSAPPASAPASWQITPVASKVPGTCFLGAAFYVPVAARLVQTVPAELCPSLLWQSAVMLHALFRRVV